MAINYASKYSQKVDEKFTLLSLTDKAVNKDYDFVGVNAVNVYSIPTSPMNDYTMSGDSRYGTPEELQDTKQTLVMSKDRSFTFTIDRRNYEDTQMTKEAGKALARQIEEVVTPEIDVYRLSKMATEAGNKSSATAITNDNAYDVFLDGQNKLLDNKVPMTGRLCYCSPKFYKAIKLDGSFIKAGDLSQNMLIKGQVGEIDGVAIIPVPSSYLAAGVEFIITHPMATTSPMKLADYKIHDNPPGINGWLVEGRVYYDAFVLTNKASAIYAHMSA